MVGGNIATLRSTIDRDHSPQRLLALTGLFSEFSLQPGNKLTVLNRAIHAFVQVVGGLFSIYDKVPGINSPAGLCVMWNVYFRIR